MFAAPVFLAVVLIQGSLGGYGGPFAPDLVAPLVLAIVFRAPAEIRTALFALFGLVRDLVSAGKFGGFAFSYAICSLPVSGIARFTTPDSAMVRLLLLFVFCYSTSVVYLVAADSAYPFPEIPAVLLTRLADAGANALLGSLLWPFYDLMLAPRTRVGAIIPRY